MVSHTARSASRPPAAPFPPEKFGDGLAVLFFAALFFFCSADQFFSVRIHGYNFRSGQALLLVGAFLALRHLAREARKGTAQWREFRSIARNWVPFFLLYAAAALTSPFPAHSLLKLAWALFNIGGALLLFSNKDWLPSLWKGFFGGILAIGALLWLQLIAIYVLGATNAASLHPTGSRPLALPGLPDFPLGFAQNTHDAFEGVPILRPNAFYYEPSYAGCALAFAFPLVFLMVRRNASLKAALAPALLLGAILFTSSRGGILCAALFLLLMVLSLLIWKPKGLSGPLARTLLLAALLVGAALLSPSIRKYLGFLEGPLGPSAIVSRIDDPQLSEGNRVANVLNSLHLWAAHPFLGNGVLESAGTGGKGLAFVSESMWLEVAVESGLLGFLAFAFALLKTLWDSSRERLGSADTVVALCAVAAHMAVNMNFTSTFPRLDYWLLFFAYASLCRNPVEEKAPQRL